jgi:hypothetical protein
VLDDEVRQILRELLLATGAESATVVHGERPGTISTQLAANTHLALALARGVGADEVEWRTPLEHAARALRAASRRWDVVLPALTMWAHTPHASPRERVLGRIADYLVALANTEHCENTLVVRRGEIIAAAHPVDEATAGRLPLITRQVEAAGIALHERGQGHGEIAGEDVYALSFWYGACLIAFFARPYSVDFVRHRAKLVTRELSELMGMLDGGPESPASILPRP